MFSVDGATADCAAHRDRATVAVLASYHVREAASLTPAAGQVIKVVNAILAGRLAGRPSPVVLMPVDLVSRQHPHIGGLDT